MRFPVLMRTLAGFAITGVALVGAPAQAVPTTAATTVQISPISLDGPAIADVRVTVTNASAARMRDLVVSFRGPVGWQVAPSRVEVGAVRAGQPARATFQLRVPQEREGFFLRTFTATATYRGGDGAGTATGTRTERSGEPLATLAEAFSNVGVTSETDTAPGDYDGEGNSFSAEKLADVGIVPGGTVEALGAQLVWPDVAPGTPDNVPSAGQAVELDGSGEKVVLLGSGVGTGATGTLTVYYTDGTSTSGLVGFPNWSFQDGAAHGATLVASSTGRNRPSGYGDAAYQYRVFAHSVPLDPAKTVDFVVLPANGNLHVFALGLAA